MSDDYEKGYLQFSKMVGEENFGKLVGSAPFYSMSEQSMGIIMYTPDGYMSAQLSKPDRPIARRSHPATGSSGRTRITSKRHRPTSPTPARSTSMKRSRR